MEALAVFLILDLHIVLLAYLIRNREAIKKWMNAPYYAENDRELYLTRRKEDVEKELAWIEAEKTK
jgi:hypothetical protein